MKYEEVDEQEAKIHLSRLLDGVERGAEVVIARAGKPIARLVPHRRQRDPRTPGGWEGRVRLAADFDSTPDEVTAAFAGVCDDTGVR